MPELPEVETVVRTLRPHVQGLTLLCAREIRPCALKGSLPFTPKQSKPQDTQSGAFAYELIL